MKTGKTLEIKVKDPDFEGLSHITLSNHLAPSTFNLYIWRKTTLKGRL